MAVDFALYDLYEVLCLFALVILLSNYVFLQTNSTEQGDYGKLIVGFQGLRKFLTFMVLENLLLSSQDLFTEPYPDLFTGPCPDLFTIAKISGFLEYRHPD